MRGTAYEIEVWSMLRVLPIGETISYGALAAKLGTRDARDVTKAIGVQSDRSACAMPSRHQEGRIDLGVSLGRQAQARTAGARATGQTSTNFGGR
jgi:alkylated DNA nucleotide flippase Atl1